jgi:hypothetical protein
VVGTAVEAFSSESRPTLNFRGLFWQLLTNSLGMSNYLAENQVENEL